MADIIALVNTITWHCSFNNLTPLIVVHFLISYYTYGHSLAIAAITASFISFNSYPYLRAIEAFFNVAGSCYSAYFIPLFSH